MKRDEARARGVDGRERESGEQCLQTTSESSKHVRSR
jgi:hypothetical protein